MRRLLYGVAVVTVASVTVSGCATKKFVRTEVDEVNAKVGTLTTALEGTQARTQQNEKGIAGDVLRFQAVSQAGAVVDSGAIARTPAAKTTSTH